MNLNNFLISEYYIYDQRSWFFSSPDMEITSLNVIVPPKSRLIPGRNFLRNGHIYHFVGDDLHKSNMVILAKNKYREVSGSSAGVKYRLWLHNFKDSLNTDTTVRSNFFIDRLKPANSLTRKELCKKKEMVERYLRLATKIFPATLDIKNIVECDWRTENVSGGRCLSSSLILADGSFIMNGGLLHELLHSFDPIDYQSYADSSRFLFSESMIEYLSRYLIRNDRTIKSKNFSLDDPFFEKYPKTPIFKIENNTQDTQYTIYVYVPWVLENFAEEIGEEKFISAYKQFHKNSLQNKSVQFEDFLKILRKFNISEESISNLVNKLNGIN